MLLSNFARLFHLKAVLVYGTQSQIICMMVQSNPHNLSLGQTHSLCLSIFTVNVGLVLQMTMTPQPPKAFYTPSDNMRILLTGQPGSRVLLQAVDKSVFFLNDKRTLTRKKVWHISSDD